MTYKEEYWEHIEYMFHAFCKVIICNAMFKTLKLKDTKQSGKRTRSIAGRRWRMWCMRSDGRSVMGT